MIVTLFKRYAASIAVVLVALSVALAVLFISSISNHTDATAALGQVRLQAEAGGECFRVNYLRWNIDVEADAGYRRDVEAAIFLRHEHIRRLAHVFESAANAAAFLPLTDCKKATGAPSSYRPPNAIPLSRVPRRQLKAALKTPPVPPKP